MVSGRPENKTNIIGIPRDAEEIIEAHLVTEDGADAGAGAVRLFGALFKHLLHEVEVGLH
jgi:hypothetical protein